MQKTSITTLAALMVLTATAGRVEGQVSRTSSDSGRPGILLLLTDDFTRPWVRNLTDGFRDKALAPADPPVLYFETLDAARFTNPGYVEELREWFRRKYRGHRIDLIVSLGEEGVDFLARKHGEPWPQTPVLYADVGRISVDTPRDLPLATGMMFEDHFPAALREIKQLFPDTRRVALIRGASVMERKRMEGVAAKVHDAGLGLEPWLLDGLSLDAAARAVANLPEDAVLFLLAPASDATGRWLTPTEACERLTSVSNRPTFTLARHDLGCGAVGGLVRDMRLFGGIVGEQALARLAGDSTPMVSVPLGRYTTFAFDERQLTRWSIAASRLPPGATLLFRTENIWRDHRRLILTALVAICLQTALITLLAVERRRRLKAEVEGRQHLAAMAHLDRRAVVGELTASLAHELNQPLGAILQNADAARLLLDQPALQLDTIKEIVDDIRQDDKRAREVIRRLRTLLRKHELETESLDVNELARETAALAAFDAATRHVRMVVDVPPTPTVVAGDRVHLQQALLNLMLNGMEAMAETPEERRRLTVRTQTNHEWVDVTVSDAGPGIPADMTKTIFDPFVTTKGEGMGMGLSITRSIVEAHGGQIDAGSSDAGGALLHFTLPLSRESAAGGV